MAPFTQLAIFSAVAQHQNITAAATALGLPKSNVSRQLQQLEQTLGMQLVLRSTRKLELTTQGQRLYQQINEPVAAIREAWSLSENEAQEVVGIIRVQLPLDFMAGVFSEILVEYLKLHPNAELCLTHYSLLPELDARQTDLILLQHEQAAADSDWVLKPVLSLPQGIYGGVHCQQCQQPGSDPLTVIRSGNENSWLFRVNGKETKREIKGRLRINSDRLRLQAAERGNGLVKAPAYLAESAVRSGRLVEIKHLGQPVALQLSALMPSRFAPFRVQHFLSFLQGKLVSVSPLSN